MSKGRRTMAIAIAVIVLVSAILGFLVYRSGSKGDPRQIGIEDILDYTSERNEVPDAVLVDAGDPVLGIVATPLACWYDISGARNGSGLRPLLAVEDGSMESIQQRFLDDCGIGRLMYLGGGEMDLPSGSVRYSGTVTDISMQAAEDVFERAPGAIVIEDTPECYELAIQAGPLASYLNVPVVVADGSAGPESMAEDLKALGVRYVIALGEGGFADGMDMDQVRLSSSDEIHDALLTVVKDRFERIDYLVLTNPADTVPPRTSSSEVQTFDQDVSNIRLETNQVDADMVGESEHRFSIDVPEGIQDIRIFINFTDVQATPLDPLKEMVGIDPSIFATLYDPDGGLSTYAPSFSREPGKDYLQVQTFDRPGTYALDVKVFYGIKGLDTYAGTSVGLSKIEGSFHIDAWTTGDPAPSDLTEAFDAIPLPRRIARRHGGVRSGLRDDHRGL